MFKLILGSLTFTSLSFASGWGDYQNERYKISYECTTKKSEISVKMSYDGSDSNMVPMHSVSIKGLDKDIEFQTNLILKNNVQSSYKETAWPEDLSNSSFQMKEGGISGHAYYRNDNNHIKIFSNKNGTKSNSIDIFIYDLNRKTKKVFTSVPCALTIVTIPGGYQ